MDDLDVPIFAILSGVLSGIALLFQVVGFATPYWYHQYGDDNHGGLWFGCYAFRLQSTGFATCGSTNDVTGWFNAVRSFEVIGITALIASVVVSLLKRCVLKDKKVLVKVRLVLQIAAVGCILLGIIIYGAMTLNNCYGFSFILCIIASLITLFAGIFSILELRLG